MSQITLTIDLAQLDTTTLTAILRQRGYTITASNSPWETPTEFCARLGLNPQSFSRLIHRGSHPFVELLRPTRRRRESTKAARILRIRSNADFEAWLMSHKEQFAGCAHNKGRAA